MNLKQLNIRLFYIESILFCSITLLLLSCAQIVPLTGGEEDVDAPKELKCSPINGTTNFNAPTVVIEFDEFIKLTNLTSQLIVSPPMEIAPEISVKGKKLMLKIKSKLAPATTYSFPCQIMSNLFSSTK